MILDQELGLAHVRLSIIDFVDGLQPLTKEDETVLRKSVIIRIAQLFRISAPFGCATKRRPLCPHLSGMVAQKNGALNE
jgi:hypothetical protein